MSRVQKQAVVPQKRRGRKSRVIRIPVGRILFDIVLFVLTVTVIPVLIYGVANPSTTALMWVRWAENGNQDKYPRSFEHWVPVEHVSPHLIQAVMAGEDQRFFHHNGFDWYAIEAAIKTNLTTDRTVGASTISMQTARNVFLWLDRSWIRKGLETYFTALMETFWSKERILEMYLNVIEWGDGIYGCEAAAQHYFHRSARDLSPVEAAWMAAILPNPRAWSLHDPKERVAQRQAHILKVMDRMRIPPLQ
ncbi:MAG: monofunctional biosynthetic peptidoglycan transglycosylase [Nitrospinaceae bacterium]|nr:monofunctional biosynthetic peptidoglycan transglycosylase [Nitrospinaceae bacterium]NIR54310.1 monofunctional biosynthetic peptidoglycan transglycosylase [Nitrospinaceae bacterium]NIS84728.1 monofunctional biosynthetic peptidoglycan transglycosylase [Nitrospinaceae bacterium]NIT81529.1 monofunctional biosynthetic peptidoglycan transglycosylase [Nitrospinaceae bacterium]NIU43814.1 monofunctional biosynthetic peptidoglycan transglycosylase [Nitrospinaceae bacterium]